MSQCNASAQRAIVRLASDRMASPGSARSIQLHASRREDHFPEVKLVFAAKGASYRSYGLCRQGYESGI